MTSLIVCREKLQTVIHDNYWKLLFIININRPTSKKLLVLIDKFKIELSNIPIKLSKIKTFDNKNKESINEDVTSWLLK